MDHNEWKSVNWFACSLSVHSTVLEEVSGIELANLGSLWQSLHGGVYFDGELQG